SGWFSFAYWATSMKASARAATAAVLAVVVLAATACSQRSDARSGAGQGDDNAMGGMPMTGAVSAPPMSAGSPGPRSPLPGMPPLLDPHDIYAADRPNELSAAVRHHVPRVYVPNLGSNTVSVIDPAAYQVIDTVRVGRGPQHVVPSWDLHTLWVNNNV